MGKDHTGGKVILNGINLVVWRDQTGGTVIGGGSNWWCSDMVRKLVLLWYGQRLYSVGTVICGGVKLSVQ